MVMFVSVMISQARLSFSAAFERLASFLMSRRSPTKAGTFVLVIGDIRKLHAHGQRVGGLV